MAFVVIIPARYASSRLPAKPLADICGKPMIQHVYEKALASGADKVVIATDHESVYERCKAFTTHVLMTRDDHESGTERLGECVDLLNLSDDTIVVNVQGDEPLLAPENVSQVAALLKDTDAPMATLSVPLALDDVHNPNAVKVVANKLNHALYFSRSAIPYDRSHFMAGTMPDALDDSYQRHIGIYAYRAGFIKQYLALAPSPIEKLESLEQLRVLYHGYPIAISTAHIEPEAGVDTPEDLARVIAYLEQGAS